MGARGREGAGKPPKLVRNRLAVNYTLQHLLLVTICFSVSLSYIGTLIFCCLELLNRLGKELLLNSSSGASATGAPQHTDTAARTTPRLRQPGCCFFSDLVILGTADKPFVHLGTTELKKQTRC